MSLICNILYISLWIISAINWLDLADISVDAQQIEAITELVPQSVVQLLDSEPLGFSHTTAFLLLCVTVVFILSYIIACVKAIRKTGQQETESLRQELVAQKRTIRLKKKQLKQLKLELQHKQEDFLVKESNLLIKLNAKEDHRLANQIKDGEIALLKQRLEETRSQVKKEAHRCKDLEAEKISLRRQLCELESKQKLDHDSYQKEMADLACEFEKQKQKIEEKHQSELKQGEDRQIELEDEKEKLEAKMFELEEKLLMSQEEESYEQMCKKIESMERDYRHRICSYQMKEHKQWLASREMERRLKAERRESAKHRQMLTDLHRKVELGQGERYLSQRRKRHVYFNEEPEVFTFEKEEPVHKSTALPSPPDYWSEVIQGPPVNSRD